ncbi:MAG: TonB family protein [Candidatus Omnitrophica bacterium]|nr:TonB family protein [Candidatus Omnitrophota bacterium]MCF7877228.1 TonB family protein [Candidatus Omnitrophota bacterium]MCF7878065.1 TonB family protein [Candidatus Omnitrophota bacterium]MCF7892746.1 TonB family protein [Candidatus Omnitrophota bacterium]
MNKLWLNSLLLSILAHFLVFSFFFFSPFSPTIKKTNQEIKKIEIIPEEPEKKIKTPQQQEKNLGKKEPLPYKENIIDKLLNLGKSNPSLDKIKPIQDQTGDILLSNLVKKENLQNNSAYMNYYRMIREKIRKKAYQRYRGQNRGKVYLNFQVGKSGALQAIKVGKQSIKNLNLKKIALNSVKDSAPFPPFPKELKNYPRLQFNISIYFKND